MAVYGDYDFVSVEVEGWEFGPTHGFYLDNGYDEVRNVDDIHVTTTAKWENRSDYWVSNVKLEVPNGSVINQQHPNWDDCEWQSRQHAQQTADRDGNTSTEWVSCDEAVVTTDYPEVEVQLFAPGDSVVFEKPVENGQVRVTVDDGNTYGDGVGDGEGWYVDSISPLAYDGTFGPHQYNPDTEACRDRQTVTPG